MPELAASTSTGDNRSTDYLSGKMPQVNVTLPDQVSELLSEMAEITGMSKSSLIAEYVRRGLYEDARCQVTVTEFRIRSGLKGKTGEKKG